MQKSNTPGKCPQATLDEEVMKRTGEVFPNLFVIGLAVAAVYGIPRMGPAFGSMILSGVKGAEQIRKKLPIP